MMMIAWRGASGEFVILQTLHVIFIDYNWLNKSCSFDPENDNNGDAEYLNASPDFLWRIQSNPDLHICLCIVNEYVL